MKFLRVMVVCALAAALMPSAAFAKGGHGHGNDHDRHDGDHDRDDHGKHWRDHDGDHDRDGHQRPAGWDKGKKTGWNGCDVPPGQAKKVGCHPNAVDHHHHDSHHQPRRVYTSGTTPSTAPAPRRTWPRTGAPTATATGTVTTRATIPRVTRGARTAPAQQDVVEAVKRK